MFSIGGKGVEKDVPWGSKWLKVGHNYIPWGPVYASRIYYTILYSTLLYYTILYYTILYYTILYYIILYYTILYYTMLYYTWSPRDGPLEQAPRPEDTARQHLLPKCRTPRMPKRRSCREDEARWGHAKDGHIGFRIGFYSLHFTALCSM